MIIIQFSLFIVILFMLFSNTYSRILSPSVFAVSLITSSIVIGLISFKLISWYKLSNYKNIIILFYGIAALTLGSSILEDAGTKLLLVEVIQEKSPPGATIESFFLYKDKNR